MTKHNFSAGPSILPKEVFDGSANAIVQYQNSGLSIIEMSHRSPEVGLIIEEAKSLVIDLLELKSNEYEVLFLQGGASLQFLMIGYNLLNNKAGYLNTGSWSEKAIKEAKFFGEVIELSSSKSNNYKHIPKDFNVPDDIDYMHMTSNNTIYGTQYSSVPKANAPIVVDSSSDIFSRVFDYSSYDLIYAGAQKNIGPAGVTLVVIKKDILGKVSREIPSMLNYNVHIEKKSLFNTPPVFAIYATLLNLRWIKKRSIELISQTNLEKAKLLYDEIDSNKLFKGFADIEDRSLMNVTFDLVDKDLSNNFDALLGAKNISGVKGHRSIGGYRASLYNALPIESVEVLINCMKELKN
ncbi:MAG: 3-phosphoserine/phosphohydroxythreonine transaminase [Flavobacteriaceae bacterium]|nr:3-phosphoserine/phosphohydroxythreonine transaminase [Flavobacteriaceae bacterium]